MTKTKLVLLFATSFSLDSRTASSSLTIWLHKESNWSCYWYQDHHCSFITVSVGLEPSLQIPVKSWGKIAYYIRDTNWEKFGIKPSVCRHSSCIRWVAFAWLLLRWSSRPSLILCTETLMSTMLLLHRDYTVPVFLASLLLTCVLLTPTRSSQVC